MQAVCRYKTSNKLLKNKQFFLYLKTLSHTHTNKHTHTYTQTHTHTKTHTHKHTHIHTYTHTHKHTHTHIQTHTHTHTHTNTLTHTLSHTHTHTQCFIKLKFGTIDEMIVSLTSPWVNTHSLQSPPLKRSVQRERTFYRPAIA